MNESEFIELAERLLSEGLWSLPGVRADVAAAARAGFEAGIDTVPEDLRDAARLGIVRRETLGTRTLTDGRARAFLLDVVGLGSFSQVVAIDGNSLLKHAVVNVLPDDEHASMFVWSVSQSITERLEWLTLLPRIGVDAGGRRHIVDFAVDPTVWMEMTKERRDDVVAALRELARDHEEIAFDHRGPILLRLLPVPAQDALRFASGIAPVYEAEITAREI